MWVIIITKSFTKLSECKFNEKIFNIQIFGQNSQTYDPFERIFTFIRLQRGSHWYSLILKNGNPSMRNVVDSSE